MILFDMDMPRSCWECRFRIHGHCAADKEYRYVGVGTDAPRNRQSWCPAKLYEEPVITSFGIFDQEEVHENCTVQILSNSVTGEVSIGWKDNTTSWEDDEYGSG